MSRTTMTFDILPVDPHAPAEAHAAARDALWAERVPQWTHEITLRSWYNGVDVDLWEAFDEDMLAISRRHPAWILVVFGEGEASDDLWYQYFCNGRTQFCPVEMVYPPMDRAYLTGETEAPCS